MSGLLAIDRLGDLAEAPLRMRSRLERATRLVRAVPLDAAPAAAVACPLPRELVDSSPLAALGERLRALLTEPQPDGGPGPATGVRRTPDAWAASPEGLHGPPVGSGASPVQEVDGAQPWDAGIGFRHAAAHAGSPSHDRRPRRGGIDEELGAWRARSGALDPPPGGARRQPGLAPLRLADRPRSADVPRREVQSRPAPPISLSEVPTARKERLPAGGEHPDARSAFHGDGPPAPLERATAASGLPPLTSRASPAIAPTPMPAGAEPRGTATPPAGYAGAAPIARPGAAGSGPSRATALRYLADDIAEILREHAISHGIDVP